MGRLFGGPYSKLTKKISRETEAKPQGKKREFEIKPHPSNHRIYVKEEGTLVGYLHVEVRWRTKK